MNFSCTVENSLSGISLRQFFKKKLPCYSNKKINAALEMGGVTINGIIERFGSKKIFVNDSISYQAKDVASASNMDILFEDEYFLAINKPIGFESIQSNLNKIFPNYYLVHRLDKNTTGVLLVAKTKGFKKQLEYLFRARKIQKNYVALVDGILEKEHGTITSYLKRKKHYQGQTIWASSYDNRGLYAKTHFKKIRTYLDFSMIALTPTTGRTHQLRVHLKELNHPILGDFQYCRKFYSTANPATLCLHANEISFVHPVSQNQIIIEAALPEIFFSISNSNE